ncbi:hypothetical protein L198_00033 [Cryptococcus wingfieldii CBS 7118]|uniref:Uncharacterized protein n=1 Tax=Cryptococcus wingfieldii CBS 7118 TaxID=1295528 RepID=A0A1E3K586_9TREE|nr:hypothetical protein L198_00033 [Cryptococcus wingfieldii CBS 7118]ODO08310.1 hypothetical protein L198_00033 [Cryptococcus wingfieldii CBS 7118]
MSSAFRVTHTTDILHIIFSHIPDNKDLASLLRTSPLFFGLIAQKLYRSLPISNVLNPFSGVDAGGRGGPYGKTKLLELVQTVVVERVPLPIDHPVWANWYKLPPLPAVETVIIHPADRNARQEGGQDTTLPNNALIERLCPTATRLHLSTPCFTAGARGVQSMPSLPCVKTLVVKANAGEIMELKYVVGKLNYGLWNHGQKERPPCLNIKAVHILLWGELVYPDAKLQSSDWDKDRVDKLAIMGLSLSTKVKLRDKIFHNLCEIAERLGTRFSIDELWLYNVGTVLERLSKWSTSRKVDDMKAEVERAFEGEMKTSAEYLGMPEEAAEAQVFWRTGLEFYEAFGDVSARDETEEWYHSAVLAPSPNLVSLRARLAAKTKFPADTFVGLTEREANGRWQLLSRTRYTPV